MSAAPLPGVFGTLAPLLDHYGYLAVAGLLLFENLGVPIVPGETMLVAGAIYAGAGLNVVVLGVIAVISSIAGSAGGYAIGRFGGRALALRYGRYVFLTSERLDKAEAFFARRGALVVTVGRFLEGLRQANGLIAGIAKMPLAPFLVFNTVGAILWSAAWTSAGYLTGHHISAIYNEVTRYSLFLLLALAVIIAVLILRYVLHRRRHAPDGDASEAAGDGLQ